MLFKNDNQTIWLQNNCPEVTKVAMDAFNWEIKRQNQIILKYKHFIWKFEKSLTYSITITYVGPGYVCPYQVDLPASFVLAAVYQTVCPSADLEGFPGGCAAFHVAVPVAHFCWNCLCNSDKYWIFWISFQCLL